MVYVYILISESGLRTYVGCTTDVERRLNEHNCGKVRSSSPYRPYRVLYTEEFSNLIEARRRERFYKGTTGRRMIHALLEDQKKVEI